MSNKQKTMWCKYLVYKKNKPDEIMEAIEEWKNFTLYFGDDDYAVSPSEEDYYECYNIKEIIGHPVMIGDVLNWIDKKMGVSNCEYEEFVVEEANISVLLWREYLNPIEDQSDECIDYVYNLIQKD